MEKLDISKHEKKLHIKKLIKDGRYFDIYNLYGKNEYRKVLLKAMYDEVKFNKGTVKARIWKVKEYIKRTIKTILSSSSALLIAVSVNAENLKIEASNNSDTYKREIGEYNEKIQNYAEKIKAMKLNDIEIFMIVMKDMWESIDGYGDPKKDIVGYLELDLATEDGVGVCRNMATDVAKKLNAIDSRYNARVLAVYVDDGKYICSNIETQLAGEKNKPPTDDKEEDNDKEKNEDKQNDNINLDDIICKIEGNHLVTLVDIPEDNLILVLDPTNPGIGVYKDGEITMFNSDKTDICEFDTRTITSFYLRYDGVNSMVDVVNDFANSFKKSNLTINQIEQKYGLKAQNETIRHLDMIKQKDAYIKSIQVNTNNQTINIPVNKVKEYDYSEDER